MKRRINYKYLVMTFIIFMGIGFAVLTSNLSIEGIFNFAESSFEVYFDNIIVNPESIEANKPVINNSKTTITFGGQLDKPGDYYEFSTDVVNNGTMGAMLDEIIKTGITLENEDFIDYTVNYYDGTSLNRYDLLPAGSRTKIIVRVEYKYDIEELPNISSNMNFSLSLKYVKSNDKAIDVDTQFYNSGKSNVFTLNNAKANTLMDLKIYGNTEQATNTGKNLLPMNNITTTYNGVTFTVNNDKSITVNGTSTSLIYYSFNVNAVSNMYDSLQHNIPLEANTTYYFNGSVYKNSYVVECRLLKNSMPTYLQVFAITTAEATNAACYMKIDENTTIKNFTIYPQLEKGSTFTGYEPYIDNESLSRNHFRMNDVHNFELINTGKNLFNAHNIDSSNISVNADGSEITIQEITSGDNNGYTSTNSRLRKLCPVLSVNDKITLSFDRNLTNANQQIYIEDGSYINNAKYYSSNTEKTITENMLNKNMVLYGNRYNNGETGTCILSNFQIEKGDKYTEFEPYKEKDYYLFLNKLSLSGIGNYKDYIYNKNGLWYVHKEIGKVILDGSQDYIYQDNYTNGIYEFLVNNINTKANTSGYSNRFNVLNSNNGEEEGIYIDELSDSKVTIKINSNKLDDTSENVRVNSLKNWLSNNNVALYYVLNTPIEEKITDTTLINKLNDIVSTALFDGVNNLKIFSNVDTDIEFNYLK